MKQEIYTDLEKESVEIINEEFITIQVTIHERCRTKDGHYSILFKGTPTLISGPKLQFTIPKTSNILELLNPLQITEIKILWPNKD